LVVVDTKLTVGTFDAGEGASIRVKVVGLEWRANALDLKQRGKKCFPAFMSSYRCPDSIHPIINDRATNQHQRLKN